MIRKKCSNKGFNLIEIMIAISLIGVVIITVCGVFVHGLDAIKKSKYRACAIRIANQKFAELSKVDFGDPNGIPTQKLSLSDPNCYIEGLTDSGSEPYISWDSTADSYEIKGHQSMDNISYEFNIKIENYKNKENIKKVTVKITWPETEGIKNIELCTLISRNM